MVGSPDRPTHTAAPAAPMLDSAENAAPGRSGQPAVRSGEPGAVPRPMRIATSAVRIRESLQAKACRPGHSPSTTRGRSGPHHLVGRTVGRSSYDATEHDIDERPDAQLPHLESFWKAAELGSFTGAAKVLGLNRVAVSQRIQALEQALGVPLFHRRGGRAWFPT